MVFQFNIVEWVYQRNPQCYKPVESLGFINIPVIYHCGFLMCWKKKTKMNFKQVVSFDCVVK